MQKARMVPAGSGPHAGRSRGAQAGRSCGGFMELLAWAKLGRTGLKAA